MTQIGPMMPEVPLVIYDPTGVRHVIGIANIESDGDGIRLEGEITDPKFRDILSDQSWPNNPDNYSIGFDTEQEGSPPVEAALTPPQPIPATKRTNATNPKFKGRIPNHDS